MNHGTIIACLLGASVTIPAAGCADFDVGTQRQEARRWTGNAFAWTGNAARWTGNGFRWTGNAARWTGNGFRWTGNSAWADNYSLDEFLHRGAVHGLFVDWNRSSLTVDLNGLPLDPTTRLDMAPPARRSDGKVWSPRLRHNGSVLQVGDSIDVALLHINSDITAVPVRATITRTPDLRRRDDNGVANGDVIWANYQVQMSDVYPSTGAGGPAAGGSLDWTGAVPCAPGDSRCAPPPADWGQYTTFIPMARPPTAPNEDVSYWSGLQMVTLPGDVDNVMASLEGKAMFYGDFPVHDSVSIDTTGGCPVPSRDLAYTTALAVGNAYFLPFDGGYAYAMMTVNNKWISVSGYGALGYGTELSYTLAGQRYVLESYKRDAAFETDEKVGSFRVAMAGNASYDADKMVTLHVSDIGLNNERELRYHQAGGPSLQAGLGPVRADVYAAWRQAACVDDEERLVDCGSGQMVANLFRVGVDRTTRDVSDTCDSKSSKAQLSVVVSPVEDCRGYAGPDNSIGCFLDRYDDFTSTPPTSYEN